MKLPLFANKRYFLRNSIGLCSITLGIFLFLFDPVAWVIKKKITMAPGSMIEDLWKEIPVEVINSVYVFNITNAEDFLSGKDSKIVVKEVGPYVYKEQRYNDNITFNDNGTMTYKPRVEIVHSVERSVGDIYADRIYTLNVPLLGIVSLYSDSMMLKKMGVNFMISSMKPKTILNITVHEFFWGYDDDMIEMIKTLMPFWIDFEKFGIIDRFYAQKPDIVTVNLDETLGHPYAVDYWSGSEGLNQWKFTDLNSSIQCNRLKGVFEGLLFPPNMPEDLSPIIYRKSFCRTMQMVRENTFTMDNGLRAYGYALSSQEFNNSRPENSCYCAYDGSCLPDGLGDISACYYGIPFALSMPHFYKGDPSLLDRIVGLNPIKEKHSTLYIIQPDIGLPLMVSAKFQLNVVMKDTKYNSIVAPFSDMILPVAWIKTEMDPLPKDLMRLILTAYVYMPVVQEVFKWLFLFGGVIYLFYNMYRFFKTPASEQAFKKSFKYYAGRVSVYEMTDMGHLKNNLIEESKTLIE